MCCAMAVNVSGGRYTRIAVALDGLRSWQEVELMIVTQEEVSIPLEKKLQLVDKAGGGGRDTTAVGMN